MSNFDDVQVQSKKPARLYINDIKSIDQAIQDYMSRISEVRINLDNPSTEVFVNAFREGFGLEEHNYLENNKGILCYDLMICQNPLDKKKKQKFYTFFTQESVFIKKISLARIYQYYLDFYPDYHIDTMLQICYTENRDEINDGFYLKFSATDCKLISIRTGKVLNTFELNSNRLNICEPYIPSLEEMGKEGNPNHGTLNVIIEKFEDYIDDSTSSIKDEKSDYKNLVDAFLKVKNLQSESKEENISIKHIYKNAYRLSLINELAVPGIKCLYFIPISFPNHKQIGHFVLSTDGADLKRDKEYIEKFKVLSFILMFPLSQANMSSIFNKKAYDESVKSAKAAIMARNMSHNIGSHVMSYLKQHLCSVTNILQDNILTDLISATSFSDLLDKIERAKRENGSYVQFVKEVSTEEGNLALPFLVGLGNFISYLQERQDFIATIATDFVPYYSTVNFKDSIYDELNPDKRYLRHKDRKNLQPDNILLGNIARSEGLGRPISPTEKDNGKLSDIVIKFRSFDGNPVVNEGNNILTGRENAFNDLALLRQIDVSLPGGMVGRQAIFSIVENILRNDAKHGDWRSQGRLELTFDFYDKDSLKDFENLKRREGFLIKEKIDENDKQKLESITKELSQIRIKLEEWNKDAAETKSEHPWGERNRHNSLFEVLWYFYSQSLDVNDLYFVTITDNVRTSESIVNRLREALADDYIDIGNESKMNNGNKGIKEIRISAAWLRGAKNEDEYYNSGTKLDKPQTDKKAPLVYVRQHNHCLQYIVCLLIPKRVAIISKVFNKEIILNKRVKQILARSYWKVFKPSEFIEEKNKSFNFVLCDGKECYEMIRPFSSSRTVELSEVNGIDKQSLFELIQDGISKEACTQIEQCLNMHFSRYKKTDFICVDDKKAFAKYSNQSSTIKYQWTATPEDKGKGYFLRQGESQKEIIVESDGLYDGMRLIPEHDYCKIGNILVTDGGGFGQYVYRTHHDGNDEFARFMGELRDNYCGCQFVESVTGNTSTDRLVRNDLFDDKWFYSHLRAMKLRIAIFDERLFAKIYGLEEVDFTRANAFGGSLDEMKKVYISKFGTIFAGVINSSTSIDELNKRISSNNALKSQLYKSEASAKSQNATVFYQKGINVFTFVRDPLEKGTYGMYGLYLNPNRTDVLNAIDDFYHAKAIKLVDLSWENDTLKITPYKGSEYLVNGFDYISIHQGLLDKLYEAFDIKDTKDKVTAKATLTKQLYLFLKRGKSYNLNNPATNCTSSQNEEQVFLPGISVHSGRSKPNKDDMPQMMPFIQYSAIEHAAMDCKYSLVELLDNARYEE